MVAGVGVTLLVIAMPTLRRWPTPPDPSTGPTLSDSEVLSLIAHDMRSRGAAARVMPDGQVRFDDGTGYVSVGGAHFHISQPNRIVVAEDPPAIQPQYR